MDIEKTSVQYDRVIDGCRDMYKAKMSDYGSSWRVLRTSSLTDQIFIKAQRIRTIQQTGANKVGDGIRGEFEAMVNYGIMALIQFDMGVGDDPDLDVEKALDLYDKHVREVKELMLKKNHDYGEAWRDMRVSSLTDLILVKLLRIKQIEDNAGLTSVSEGIDSNYQDIINYSVFALIHIDQPAVD